MFLKESKNKISNFMKETFFENFEIISDYTIFKDRKIVDP